MYVLHVDTLVTMGCSIDSLDICFRNQLAASRGDIVWIGVDAHFRPTFSGRNFGALFEVLCVKLNIMNMRLFDAY